MWVFPQPVPDEVVTESLEAGHVDARRVEQAVEAGTRSVRPAPETELADRLGENPNLAEADVAVIALAASEEGVAIVDEGYGRATADTEGVETSGTAAILGEAVRDGRLTGADAIDVLDAMIDAGWYCSPELYTRIVGELPQARPN